MNNVATALSNKVKPTVSIHPENTVLEALQMMADKNVGSVVVKDSESYYDIFTERDYARNVILKNRHSSNTKVRDVMSVNVPEVNTQDSLEHCLELMSNYNIRYLPVMNHNEFVNIISITDLIREKVNEQKEVISHLQNYIQG